MALRPRNPWSSSNRPFPKAVSYKESYAAEIRTEFYTLGIDQLHQIVGARVKRNHSGTTFVRVSLSPKEISCRHPPRMDSDFGGSARGAKDRADGF